MAAGLVAVLGGFGNDAAESLRSLGDKGMAF